MGLARTFQGAPVLTPNAASDGLEGGFLAFGRVASSTSYSSLVRGTPATERLHCADYLLRNDLEPFQIALRAQSPRLHCRSSIYG